VTLAGLINALQVAGKALADCRIVLYGAGASNTTIASLILQSGADPARMALFDSRGGLHAGRDDIEADPRFYRKWDLCRRTNPGRLADVASALQGADVLISLSRPGPDVIRPEWVRCMARNAIVFACANPVPEIYPHAAKAAGALVVATGRGDFPNQVNNSLGFPGILKGALLVRARKITDAMAIAAAHTIAAFAARQGLTPDRIMPLMTEQEVFAETAGAVARQAQAEGVARRPLPPEQVQERARKDIAEAQSALEMLVTAGLIPPPPEAMVRRCLDAAIAASGS
jgi:malate dehydrogenase (oxaloacetate-decarboxylating)